MSRLLRIQDKILIGLSLIGDVFDEIRTAGDLVGGAYEAVYGFTPKKYKKSNFNTTLSRMLSSDLIEKVIKNGEPQLRLTSTGKNKMVRNFPLFQMQNRQWDKKWRVLAFDIPEKKRNVRNALRRKLKEFGFGMVQQSVWISPHPFEEDINEFIAKRGLGDNVYLFISSNMVIGDIKDFSERIWNLEKLNESYEKVFYDEDMEKYMKLILIDPFLPKDLLPELWWGFKSRMKYRILAMQSNSTAV